MRSDRSTSLALGKYFPDRFLGQLGNAHVPVDSDDDRFAIFAHEYWHYLQNTTTPTGLDSFRLTQALLVMFSRTMSPSGDGTSRGASVLSHDDAELMRGVIQRRIGLVGKPGPEGRKGSDEIIGRVVEIVPAGLVTVELTKRRQRIQTPEQFRLGSHAIEESIAHLVEMEVRRLVGASYSSAPEFPYRVLERVVEHACGTSDEPPAVIAGLGTLSLMSDGPGQQLSRMVRLYAEQRAKGGSPLVALQAVVAAEAGSIEQHLDVLGGVIDEIEKMHAGRGMSEHATKYLCDQYRRAFKRRRTDPLFDLAPLLDEQVNAEKLLAHMKGLYQDFPPCDFIVEERDEVTGRPTRMIVTAHPPPADPKELQVSDYLRSFQAQQEFMEAHLGPDGFHPTSEIHRSCPYLGMCEHPLHKAAPDVCASAPWEHIRGDGPDCWFTNGVWATMGIVELRRM